MEPQSLPAVGGGGKQTPLLMRVLDSPQPVKGSDGKYHLVYELVLTNSSPGAATVESVKTVDPKSGEVVGTLGGADIAARTALLGDLNSDGREDRQRAGRPPLPRRRPSRPSRRAQGGRASREDELRPPPGRGTSFPKDHRHRRPHGGLAEEAGRRRPAPGRQELGGVQRLLHGIHPSWRRARLGPEAPRDGEIRHRLDPIGRRGPYRTARRYHRGSRTSPPTASRLSRWPTARS